MSNLNLQHAVIVNTKLYSHVFYLELTKRYSLRLRKGLSKMGRIDELLVKALVNLSLGNQVVTWRMRNLKRMRKVALNSKDKKRRSKEK